MGSDVLVLARNMKIYGIVTTYVLKKAALVTSDSLVLNEASIEFGAKREKVHLIQNGVDRRMFNEKVDKSIFRSRLGLGDGPIILSTRTLHPLYNIDCLIKAMPLILKCFPKAKLVLLYFSIELEEDLKLLARQLGVETAVVFVGQVKYDEMPYYHAGADVSVSVPSSDSSPCSVYESMASGTPVVVSDLPWIKHFIREGLNALVVSLRDPSAIARAVMRIIAEKDLNEKLRENGLATVRSYVDYETNMKKMAEIMENLLKNSLRRSAQ
jgi:glycosyltransferase involved in cell wall biosynthesis